MPLATSVKPIRRKPHELEGQIVDLLRTTGHPMGGQEISRRLSATGRAVVPMLVFRALARLVQHNTVCRVETFSAYIIAPKEPSIKLLCTDCGSCCIVPDANAVAALERLASIEAFSPHRCIIEVQGRCPRCNYAVESAPVTGERQKLLEPQSDMMYRRPSRREI